MSLSTLDAACWIYAEASRCGDYGLMRRIRSLAPPEVAAALDEILDGLIHEGLHPDMTDAEIDRLDRGGPTDA